MSASMWVLDQMDGGWASLSPAPDSVQREPISLPVSLLPPSAREGDALRLELSEAPALTASLKAELTERAAALSEGDDGGDFSI